MSIETKKKTQKKKELKGKINIKNEILFFLTYILICTPQLHRRSIQVCTCILSWALSFRYL